MKVFIFTGPTLRPDEARATLDAIYLPPVQQGDVYRAAREGPVAIGIIDGFFEHVPAVWHKEILWALSEGIHVFGASSMGALRAAELSAFGMEGVGEIFAAFHRGELEDDDDVAVAHGASEDGWRPLSEAMVNISATLSAAWLGQVVREETRNTLERVAKSLFYMERAWPVVLARGAREGVPASELEALKAWLPTGRVDQKKADALALLRTMRERLDAGLSPKKVAFPFQHTDAWEEARRRAGRLPLVRDGQPLEGVAPE
ncbi:TfuA-like protein, partial [Pyxidicoccus sp. 3LFB2]